MKHPSPSLLLVGLVFLLACNKLIPSPIEDAGNSDNPMDASTHLKKRVGIFYAVWHAPAADAIQQVPLAEQYTIEDIIRTPALAPSAVLETHGLLDQASRFHYHVKPKKGYYCIYRPRQGEERYSEPNSIENCDKIQATLEAHAKEILAAGVDFIYVDITNFALPSPSADVMGIRPLEVLFEEWQALRDKGIKTPDISVWVPFKTPPIGTIPTWKLIEKLYDNPKYADLILRDKKNQKVWFSVAMQNTELDSTQVQLAEKKNSVVVPLGALHPQGILDNGISSWMQPCLGIDRNGNEKFTTRISLKDECGQAYTRNSPIGSILSVTTSYQLSYASLSFLSSGRNNGLTFKKQFRKAFEVQPDWLLINAWNEFIAQPQLAPAITDLGPLARSMSIVPTETSDTSDSWLWVDMYGAEFSRDIEPSEEYGDTMYELMKSCLQVYRAGGCNLLQDQPCCTLEQEHNFVWSVRKIDSKQNFDTEHFLTIDKTELQTYLATPEVWEEVCTAMYGPPGVCERTANLSGDTSFLIFSKAGKNRLPLHYCVLTDHGFFLSVDPDCEGRKKYKTLGYVSTERNSASPRPLSRCRHIENNFQFHWLGESCPELPSIEHVGILGFVR